MIRSSPAASVSSNAASSVASTSNTPSSAPSGPDTGTTTESTDYVITALSEEEAVPDEFTPVIVAENTTRVKRLSVSEAVVDLDLTGAAALVFRHAGHGRVNVVYRRSDGHIGWIDLPPAAAEKT